MEPFLVLVAVFGSMVITALISSICSFCFEVIHSIFGKGTKYIFLLLGVVFCSWIVYLFLCNRYEEAKIKRGDDIIYQSVSADYDRSIEDMIWAARLNRSRFHDLDIKEENFPACKEEQGKKVIIFKLYSFSQRIESQKVIQEMEKEGYRPATMRELLIFREAHPESDFYWSNIIALGSPLINSYGYPSVPGTWLSDGIRLNTDDHGNEWDYHCRFLAVQR